MLPGTMNTQRMVWSVVAVVLVLGAGFFLLKSPHSSTLPGNTATSTNVVTGAATTTLNTGNTTTGSASTANPLPVDPADHLTSWSLGTPSAATLAHAQSDQAALRSELGKGQYPDYGLYIGIAQDYVETGDGKSAYDTYLKAISVSPQSGLAYTDLGSLFGELHAYVTATHAFQKAMSLEPAREQYALSYLQFLTTYTPKAVAVQTAFDAARRSFPTDPNILIQEAQWYEEENQIASAIATWKKVLPLVSADAQESASVQAEIDRLNQQAQ